MSGAKRADVQPKLNSVVNSAQKMIAEARKNGDRLNEIGGAKFAASQDEATRVASAVEAAQVTADMAKYAPEEARLLEQSRRHVAERLAAGTAEADKAEALRKSAAGLRSRSERLLQEAVGTAQVVARRLAADGLGWYLDAENAAAQTAKRQAQEALALEREASNALKRALEHSRKAKDFYDEAASAGKRYQARHQAVAGTVARQAEAARIAEANQRAALSAQGEIQGALQALGALAHEKFAPGELSRLQPQVSAFEASCAAGDYASAAKSGPQLSSRLRELASSVEKAQAEYEAARIAATNALSLAEQEVSGLSQEELVRWTGDGAAVRGAFAALSEARAEIGAERFSEASAKIASALEVIRREAAVASDNQGKAEQRNYVAEVIMNALYEQGYDAPSFYYAKQNEDGSDVEFSDLTIFAKAPGTQGDMRMNIDLSGKVQLEVEGIGEGEEGVCHQLIENQQQGVGGEIDFTMTDWGRAAGVAADRKVALARQQEQVKERQRERGGAQ